MDRLLDRISGLTREEALEAALALRDAFPAGDSDGAFVREVEQAPFQHVADVDDLARMILVVAVADPVLRPQVEEIVDAVGRRAFIFGGAEIVALAGLGYLVLISVLARGKAKEKEEFDLKADGTFSYRKETVYIAGTDLARKVLDFVGGQAAPPT